MEIQTMATEGQSRDQITLCKQRRLTSWNGPPDCVRVQIERVDLKVQPVERKRLDQAEHRLPKERIDAKLLAALVQQTKHTGAKHKCDERAGTLDAVLNVGAGEELEVLSDPVDGLAAAEPQVRPVCQNHEHGAKGVKE